MHLCDRINSGMLFYEHGHTDPVDIHQERQLQDERDHCKEVMFEYNNTHPREDARRHDIMKSILGSAASVSSLSLRCICPTVSMCILEKTSIPTLIWCWWMTVRSSLAIRS